MCDSEDLSDITASLLDGSSGNEQTQTGKVRELI